VAPTETGMRTLIDRFFSPDEVKRLECSLPRLEDWSTSMLVPFQAQQLRNASIAWINRRWFLERGIRISDPKVERRASNWLIHEFGYSVPRQEDPPHAFTGTVRTLYADRYGNTTGKSMHGGSGRVATIGCFQAKGIGITPLAGRGANLVHSHGCASLEEGVREAIYAEVACAEFPHGAVPILAILDTGLHFMAPSRVGRESQQERRAIIVRPAVLRLAHAERAPMFIDSLTGFSNSQLEDAQRTKDVVQGWLSGIRKPQPIGSGLSDLSTVLNRIAEQVAFGQVHRLFNGGYFSSNLSVAGELLDFGAMRALPNWANARTLDQVVGYGEEMKIVMKVIQSLVFHFNKYRPRSKSAIDQQVLISRCSDAYKRAFEAECLRMCALDAFDNPALCDSVVPILRAYFAEQQKLRVDYKHGLVKSQGWLFDAVIAASGAVFTGLRRAGGCSTARRAAVLPRTRAVATGSRERVAGCPHNNHWPEAATLSCQLPLNGRW
jgi:hypothetical protein